MAPLDNGDLLIGLWDTGVFNFTGGFFNLPLAPGPGGLQSGFVQFITASPAGGGGGGGETPTNVKIVDGVVVGDVTVDPKVVSVQYNNADLPAGSVLRNTTTGKKYMKTTGGTKSYSEILVNPDPAWGWTSGSDAWTRLQNF